MNKVLYFDAAASAQKPQSVIDAGLDFMTNHYANAGRGVCSRATAVDDMVAQTRAAVADFIGARSSDQIIFTNGTTDGMNKIANMLMENSVVAVSDIDHHSARLPFANRFKTVLCGLDSDFNITDVPKASAVVITAMSNVLGAAQDVRGIIRTARAKNPNIVTIVDAAQYVAHLPINVSDWECDFLCFSGHKIGGDTGIGVMYIRNPDKWQPSVFGGGMYMATGPSRFEAGTLPLVQISSLPYAIKETSDKRQVTGDIVKYLHDELSKMPRVKLFTYGDSAMVSFIVDGMHALDFGAMMGAHNVCLRVGNMCASWLHERLGIIGTIRISPGQNNTMDEAVQVIEIVKKIIK